MMRKRLFLSLGLASTLGVWSPVHAAPISREALERQLLDTCIYRQFAVKDVRRASMVEDCRCASRTAMKGVEGSSFDQPRSGGLTAQQDQALKAAIAACFKG